MEIIRGKVPGAKKVVIYGPEGIGKSTFASKFPEPLFLDTEGSTKDMDVQRFTAPKSWEDIIEAVKYAKTEAGICKTLVIDTADWAEMLCIQYTCKKGGVNGIEDFGYGKGYTYVQENFKKFLDALTAAVESGINVVITAHAKMRKFEQPDEMGAYDRWEMKLSKQVAPMLKEWADMVLFANYKTFVVEDDKTKSKKAQGGKRVMYTTHNPCWDAKNRYGLDECVAFDYEAIRHIIEPGEKAEAPKKVEAKKEEAKLEPKPEPKAEKKETPKKKPEKKEDPKPAQEEEKPEVKENDENWMIYAKLRQLMEKDGIDEERLTFAVATKGAYMSNTPIDQYDPQFIQKSLIDKWDGFVKYAKKLDMDAEAFPFN